MKLYLKMFAILLIFASFYSVTSFLSFDSVEKVEKINNFYDVVCNPVNVTVNNPYKIINMIERNIIVCTPDDELNQTQTCTEEISFDMVSSMKDNFSLVETCLKNIAFQVNIGGEIKRVDFDNKGCFVKGDSLICLSNSDGFSENRDEKFKGVCRSGETCTLINLTTGLKIYERTDNVKIQI